jgi:putative SOS response-associated peptidase YedK
MYFYKKQTKKATEIEFRYNAFFEDPAQFITSGLISGFTFPRTPVITSTEQKLIRHFNWGLIPECA